jgi:alpha-glucosidase (family GH31 glycosyl hydrolase)
MPMMQFSVAPWRVLSKENLEICVNMARLHVRMGDEIIALARTAARTGEPIIRSMEYTFPGKDYVDITDQFLLGDEILVAPITEKGAVSREIIFPEGKWEGDDGSLVEGPVTLEVAAPIERLPWYRKKQ